MELIKKLATWFVKKIHVSKLKLLISTPTIIASVASVSLDFEKQENAGFKMSFNKDEQSIWLIALLLTFVLALIIFDVIVLIKENSAENRRLDKALLIIQDPNISEDIKNRMVDYLEKQKSK